MNTDGVTSGRAAEGEWLMGVENGLSAHFKEDNGTSREGVQWTLGPAQEMEHTIYIGNPLTRLAATSYRKLW